MGEGRRVSSCLGRGFVELDITSHQGDLVSAALGCGVLNGSDAISAVLHIPDRASVDQGRPVFVERPVWPGHGRDRVVQGIRLTTRARFVSSKRGDWRVCVGAGVVICRRFWTFLPRRMVFCPWSGFGRVDWLAARVDFWCGVICWSFL